jgi:hypothetical protein
VGNDALNGGAGNDTYLFGRGGGKDTINDSDPTAGNSDTVAFAAGLTPLDLIFSRNVNHLRLALYGSTDQVEIQRWYNGASAQVEVLQAGDGSRLLNAQVDQLIQAMASYSAGSGLTWEQAIAQHPEDVQAILAAHWQPPAGG